MKKFLPFIKAAIPIIVLLILVGLPIKNFAQATGDYRASSTGNWSALATWQRFNNGNTWTAPTAAQGYPGQKNATANVTIAGGFIVTLDVSPANAIASLQLGSNSNIFLTGTGGLTFGAFTLNVTNAATLGVAGTADAGTVNMTSGGILNCSSIADTYNGTGTVNTWTYGTGTLQLAGSGTLPATAAFTNYYNLTILAGANTVTLGQAITINNTLTLTSGTLDVASANSYAISILGNWTNNSASNAFKSRNGTVSLSGTTQAINGSFSTTFNTLVIDVASNTTVSVNNTCAALTFNAATSASSLTQNGTSTLTVNGVVTINQPAANVTTAWNINGGSATVSGLITFGGTNTNTSEVAKIVISTGTLNAYGGITFVASAAATKIIDMSAGAGILNLQGVLTVPTASSTLTAGSSSTFDYTDNTVQTINFFSSGAYNNLYIDNTGGNGAKLSAAITTANVIGNISVGSVNTGSLFSTANKAIGLNTSQTLTIAAGSTMAAGSSVVSFGTGGTAIINGQLNTANTSGFSGSATSTISATNTPAITLGTSSTIAYTSATGGQLVTGLASDAVTVLAYNNLAFTNTSGTNTANANIVVNGILAITNAGSTFDLGPAFTLSGTLTTVSNIGTISTEVPTSTSAIPIPTGKTWGGTIVYGSTSGSQTVVTGIYSNLTLSGSVAFTLGGAANVNAIMSLTGGFLTLGASNLTIGPAGSISGTFSASFYIKTSGSGQLKQTVGTTQVTFPVGNSYYNPLLITNTGTSGVYGVNVVDGTPPSLWDPTEVVNASWVVTQSVSGGVLSLVAGWIHPTQEAVNFAAGTTPEFGVWNGSSWSQVGATEATSPSYTYTTSSTFSTVGTFAIGKNNCFKGSAITYYSGATGTLDQLTTWWANTNGTGSHPTDFVTQQQTFDIQTSASLGASWTVTGTGSVINVGNGSTQTPTFTVGDPYVLTVNSGAVINLNAGSTLLLSTSGSLANITAGTLNATSTVNFASTASQTVPAFNYGNLTSSSTGARVLASSGTTGIAGTFTPGTNTYTVTGSTISFNGSGTLQTIPAFTFNNLTLANSSGTSLGGNASIGGVLLFSTSGNLSLQTYNLTITAATGSISGASSTQYIVTNSTGQLMQTVGSAQVTFPVGNSYYDPLKITNIGTSGVYGVNVVDGTPPSLWDPTKVVNASWVVSQATSGGILSLVAQWVSPTQEASNFAAGTTPEIGLWNGTSWSQVTATQSSNTFNSAPNNFTSVGTFAVGKDNCFIGSATTYYSGPSGTLDQLTTWWTGTGGTGSHPSDFVAQKQTFVIQNSASLAANWSVTGTGSVINVGNGTTQTPTFTVGNPYVLTVNSGAVINVNAGSTLLLSTTGSLANITPGTLNATSTVNFASTSSQTIPALNYGNLTSSSTGARVLASSGTIGIAGTLTPGSNTYTITGSTINFNGTGQTIPAFNYYNVSNTTNITLAGSGSIGIEAVFTTAGTYKVSGSTVAFNGQSGDANQNVPLITSTDLGSGNTAGGYNNLTISSAVTTFLPFTSGSSALGKIIPVYGTLTCSGIGQVVFNNATTAGNVNTFNLGSFSSTSSAGTMNLGSLAGAGTSLINVYGNFLVNGGQLYTASTGNNAIVNFNGTSASPQQFACVSARQVWFYINPNGTGAVVNMTGNVVLGSASSSYPAYLIVFNGGTFNCATYIVTSQDAFRIANAYFILQSGATLGIGSPYGITANVPVGAANAGNIQLLSDSTSTLYRSFSSGANYVYNGSTSQITGIFATTPTANTVSNLYIQNPAGVSLSQPMMVSTGLYIGNVGSATANITAVNNSIFYDAGNQVTCTGSLNLGTLPYAPVSSITNASSFIVGSSSAATSYPSFATNNIGAGTTVYYNGGSSSTGQVVANAPNYYNLAISSGTSTTAAAKTLGGNVTLYGALSIAANNTLDVTSSNYSITIGGNWGNAGIFTARNGTVFFNGGAINTQAEQTYQLLNAGGSPFYNLTHNNTYSVSLVTSPLTTTNNFLNSAGVFDASTSNLAHIVGNSSTGAGSVSISGGGYLAGTAQQTFYGGLNISGGIFAGAYSSGYIPAASLVTVGSPTQTSPNAGGVNLSNGTLIAPTNLGTFTVYGNWAQSGGIFTPGAGTLTFTGTTTNGTTQTISIGSSGTAVANSAFNNISHTGNAILQIINAPLTTGGTFTNTSTAGNFNANGNAHTIGGLATIIGSSYLPSTGQQTFNGGLTINGSTATFNGLLNSLVSASNVTISAGTLTAPGTTGTFTVSGNWFCTSGIFAHNNGTVTFNASLSSATQILNAGAYSFYNIVNQTAGTLQLALNPLNTTNKFTNNSGTFNANNLAHTVTVLATLNGGNYNAGLQPQTFNGTGIAVSGGTFTGSGGVVNATNVNISSGAVTAPSASGAFNVSGNWANTGGTFAHNSGTVTFLATSPGMTISGSNLTGANAFNKVVFNGTGGVWAINNNADAASDFTLTNGTVNGGSVNINVGGNWINNSTFTPSTGTVTFFGSNAQSISGSNTTTFYNLGINNSSGTSGSYGVNFVGKLPVGDGAGGGLILTNGILNTSAANLLVMNNGSATTGGSNSPFAFVNGPMKKIGIPAATFMFPVGKVNSGSPAFTGYAGAGLTEATASATDSFTVEYFQTVGGADNLGWELPSQYTTPTAAQGLQRVSSCDYWMINYLNNPTSIPTAATSVTLTYNNSVNECAGTLDYVTSTSTLTMAHFNNHVGTTNYGYWDNHAYGSNLTVSGTTGSTGTGSVTWSNVPAFSPFSLGSTNISTNPLPIRLDYFTAVKANGYNKLLWKAECTSSSSGFVAERSSDGLNFSAIDSVKVNNASDCSVPFNYNDYTSAGTKVYYRIKMVDIDGDISYSDIRLILNNARTVEIMGIRPNPVHNEAWLNISSSQSDKVELVILSIDGRELQRSTWQVQAGSETINLRTESLAKGVYIIRGIFSNGQTNAIKFVKE